MVAVIYPSELDIQLPKLDGAFQQIEVPVDPESNSISMTLRHPLHAD
jgi:hypothetical protein